MIKRRVSDLEYANWLTQLPPIADWRQSGKAYIVDGARYFGISTKSAGQIYRRAIKLLVAECHYEYRPLVHQQRGTLLIESVVRETGISWTWPTQQQSIKAAVEWIVK